MSTDGGGRSGDERAESAGQEATRLREQRRGIRGSKG